MASLHCYCFYVYAARLQFDPYYFIYMKPDHYSHLLLYQQTLRCYVTWPSVNLKNVWRTEMEPVAFANRFWWIRMGSTMRRHVYLFKFAPTPADSTSLLHCFSCGNTNDWLYAAISWHCYSPLFIVATGCIVTSRDPQAPNMAHQQLAYIFNVTLVPRLTFACW